MLDLTDFKNIVSNFVYYLDDVNGYKLYQAIEKENLEDLEKDEENMGAYLALEFLVIPFLSTKQIVSLLGENLSAGLRLDDIDLSERITKKLLWLDLGDRDNCKKELKNALINSKERLTEEVTTGQNKRIITVADWIKDYVSQTVSGSKTILDEAQYFYQKPYFVNLNEDEKNLLKKLFDLYKFLDTSSLTPEGFEDDLLLLDEQGRVITTNKGKVVILYDPKKVEKKIFTTDLTENIDDKKLTIKDKQINDLQQMANRYTIGSLERKAIEEELEKMEGGGKKIG